MITQTVLDYVRRLSTLHDLIRSQDTGGIRDLAVRLHVSERTVRNYIDELKSLGASVSFSRNKKLLCERLRAEADVRSLDRRCSIHPTGCTQQQIKSMF